MLGIHVTEAFLDEIEALALACAAKGITLAQWYALARAEVER